jgi:hypothetical protein
LIYSETHVGKPYAAAVTFVFPASSKLSSTGGLNVQDRQLNSAAVLTRQITYYLFVSGTNIAQGTISCGDVVLLVARSMDPDIDALNMSIVDE